MAVRKIKLEEYGNIILNPINIKDKDAETVTQDGSPVKRTTEGERAKTVYKTEDGTVIPGTQLCKKFEIDGDEIIAPKFKPTSEVPNDDIEESESSDEIEKAIDRKIYNISTESKKLKDLILNKKKTLKFPVVFGNGWKIYNGILTARDKRIVLVGCRGNFDDALKQYEDDVVELDLVPRNKNAKKLLKAFSY